uniref:DNA2/NAM7 helicase helicase domain-containing protein n=1 Tax=Labrus bergylta TaxID=56723 RepID=A0A3Q3N0K8_9LABR
MEIQEELKRPDCGPCVELPLTLWKDTVEALDKEDWKLTKDLIMKESDTDSLEEKEAQSGHEMEINLDLSAGDTLQIQMTSDLKKKGYHMPAVQLVRIKPKSEICVEHVHSPITCFSRSAADPSKNYYRNLEEYVQIWIPLCEMESAANAVKEEDSIVIKNLVLTFKQQQRGTLSGSFFLPQAWIDKWAIECDLSQCFLCIRKKGLKLTSTPEHSVAHGVTRKFDINHLPMETIPYCVFQKNTTFTVEIIPKCDRKENAVDSMMSASDLVRTIALGCYVHVSADLTCRVHSLFDKPYSRRELDNGLPELNMSQRLAVNKALNNTFIVIQGPPGTGKTVVGVYLVYCFFELNSQSQRKSVDPNDKNKKEIILYCGPSNKSVEVVAGKFLCVSTEVTPAWRCVFSYPTSCMCVYCCYTEYLVRDGDAGLPLSRRHPSVSPSITLHHRMREDQNPYSKEINKFDKRIEVARRTKNKSAQMSDEEVKE